MKILSLDTETTIAKNASPFFKENKLCVVSSFDGHKDNVWSIEYDENPYGDKISDIKTLLQNHTLIVGFNFKFDLLWLQRYGILFGLQHRFWDCQLVEYIISGQQLSMPSLENTCVKYNIPGKWQGGLNRYWDAGIDTTEIPWDELEPYAKQDAKATYEIYLEQRELLGQSDLLKVVQLSNADLPTLAEMEWNGLEMDLGLAKEREIETSEKLDKICSLIHVKARLQQPINLNSPNQVSALVYGGVLSYKEKVLDGVYKTGLRIDQPKLRWIEKEIHLPRLCEPLRSSKLQKDGYWSTSSQTLQNLSCKGTAREIVRLLLDYSKHEKLLSTYYRGIPELSAEQSWGSCIHGRYNQTIARTGRLSSSRPNMQNFAKQVNDLIVSRFK